MAKRRDGVSRDGERGTMNDESHHDGSPSEGGNFESQANRASVRGGIFLT